MGAENTIEQHVVSVWSKRRKGAGCGCWYRRDFRLITRTLNLSTAGVNLFAGAVGKVSIPLYRPRQQRSHAAARNTPINLHHIEAQSLKNQSTSTEMETQGRQAYPMTLTQFILEEQHHHPTAQVRRLFFLSTRLPGRSS